MGGEQHRHNLLQPPATRLPDDPAVAMLAAGSPAFQVAAAHPTSSLAWAVLAEQALAVTSDRNGSSDVADAHTAVQAYAYARTGYHRGLDALRRAGWKGAGPVPWSHVPNRGFLRALAALARAAEFIGETDESERCRHLVRDSSAEGAAALDM